jgi:hypothetical protein
VQTVSSISRFFTPTKVPELARPQLELSGPALAGSFETLVAATDAQGGIEQWIEALKLRQIMFNQALDPLVESGNAADLPLETFKNLCAFMASVRRRVAPWLEQPHWDGMARAIAALVHDARDTTGTDQRISEFCSRFPQDRDHRWVRDLAADLLHGMDPERYPLMCRWVWDRKANSGVLREIWFDEEVDNITINVPDGYATFIMLREELSQFLTENGVFRDVLWYVDLLCARIYASYIASQGGVYLRADFSAPDDPMAFARRMLGLDGVRAGSGRTRLKTVDGEAYVLDTDNTANDQPETESKQSH